MTLINIYGVVPAYAHMLFIDLANDPHMIANNDEHTGYYRSFHYETQ